MVDDVINNPEISLNIAALDAKKAYDSIHIQTLETKIDRCHKEGYIDETSRN